MKVFNGLKKLAFAGLIIVLLSCGETKRITEQDNANKASVLAEASTAELLPIADGKITTAINGFDVQSVNLWSSTGLERIITTQLFKGQEIRILRDEHPYYLIETTNEDSHRGYCMKEFVVMVTKRE